jgi:cell division protein DivIC
MDDPKAGARKALGMKSVLAVNAAILALATWGFFGEYSHNQVLAEEIARLDARKAELATTTSQLMALGDKLATGDILERDARTKLGLMKPGEEVVVVRGVPSRAAQDEPVPSDADDGTPASNAAKWLQYFFPPAL